MQDGRRPRQAAPRCCLAGLLLALLCCACMQIVQAASPKVACAYNDRYCQLRSRYIFGSTVVGDQVYFHGGLQANDASVPINGSVLEMVDLRDMSAYVMQVQPNQLLNTSRYRHQLVNWKGSILAVGGQVDDLNGQSHKVLNILQLDMASRSWSLKREFKSAPNTDIIFEQALVVGDTLCLIAQSITTTTGDRIVLTIDLNTNDVTSGGAVFVGAGQWSFLQQQLAALTNLTAELPIVDQQYLVLQAARIIPKPDNATLLFTRIFPNVQAEMFDQFAGSNGPSPYTFTTPLQPVAGGLNSTILGADMLGLQDTTSLVWWVRTRGNFGEPGQVQLNALVVYTIDMPLAPFESPPPLVTLKMSHLFVAPPSGTSLSEMRTIDLPVHGRLALGPGDLGANGGVLWPMPFIGRTTPVSDLDSSNVVSLQKAPGGFIVRGNAKPEDPNCIPGEWRPFVLRFQFGQDLPAPRVTGESNYTWCAAQVSTSDKPSNMSIFTTVQASNSRKQAARLLQRVDGVPGGPLMLLLSPVVPNLDTFASNMEYDLSAPIQGVYVSMSSHAVEPFPILASPENYTYPVSVASCVTSIPGTGPVYVEYGGKDTLFGLPQAGVSVMGLYPSQGIRHSLATTNSDDMPARAAPGMACAPDGRAWAFGGASVPTAFIFGAYQASDDFNAMTLSPAPGPEHFKVGVQKLVTPGPRPAPRHSHAMQYLAPEVVRDLGMKDGALLMYGGTNSTVTDLSNVTYANDASEVLGMLLGDTWLYDLGGKRWLRVQAQGDAPPPMMWHSMAVHGKQAMLFGGRTVAAVPGSSAAGSTAVKWSLVSTMYVLDFSMAQPRWRTVGLQSLAIGGALDTSFPASSIVTLPETQSMALMYLQSLSLAPLPRSIQLDGSAANPQLWTDTMEQLSTGDWVRLAPAGGVMSVKDPLLVPTGITVSGVSTGVAAAGGDRALTIQCQNETGVVIRSGHVTLENITVTGCNGTAVEIFAEPTGQLSQPVLLRNISLTSNLDARGDAGAALRINTWAAAVLEDCIIRRNAAMYPHSSAVHVLSSSNLTMSRVLLADNNASALLFEGQELSVIDSIFSGNSGFDGAAIRMMLGPDTDGSGASTCSSGAAIVNTTFAANTAEARGGALLVGPKVQLSITDSNFTGNRAAEGGAGHVSGEGCLWDVQRVRFTGNHANATLTGIGDQLGNGGALSVLASACGMRWAGVTFEDNTASANGGAVYVSQTSNKSISAMDSVFSNNTAYNGHGGAMFLGVWSSDTVLTNTTFVENQAGDSGGALAMLGITSRLQLLNSFAAGNAAGGVAPVVMDGAKDNQGGAVYILGNSASLMVANSTLTGNAAFEGGAISHSSAGGILLILNSRLSGNTAQQSGGAVHASVGIACGLDGSQFASNMASSDAGVGGALVCDHCASVAANNCTFLQNMAPYGGAAALLAPQGSSSITASSFVGNSADQQPVAAPAPVPSCPASSPLCRRKLMQQAFPLQPVSQANPVLGGGSSNGTSVSNGYRGGGALFVQLVSAPLTISRTNLTGNTGINGGALVALTDQCRPNRPGVPECAITLDHTNLFGNNATGGAGGAMLVTDLSRAYLTCGSSNTALQLSLHNASSADEPCIQALQRDNSAGGYGSGIATAASRIMICKDGFNTKGECLGQASNVSLTLPPGRPFSLSAVVLDQWGRRVVGDINDANMLVSVSVAAPKKAQVVFLGNTTQAVNGDVRFSAILMYSKPAQYELEVTSPYASSVLRPARLSVNLRTCIYGEVTNSATAPFGAECQQCDAPSYSFDPSQTSCQLCTLDTPALCNGSTKLPYDGYWHSSPRSNQVHKCLFPRACTRSPADRAALLAFTEKNAAVATTSLNDTFYMDGMCAEGYTGPLCGACSDDYGRRGQSCVKCPGKPVNSFIYFLLCLYLFVLVLVAGFMHVKQVQRRQMQALMPSLPAGMQRHVGAANGGNAKGGAGHGKQPLGPLFETQYCEDVDAESSSRASDDSRAAGSLGNRPSSSRESSDAPLVTVQTRKAGSGGLPDIVAGNNSLESDQMMPSVFATAAGVLAANATLSPRSNHGNADGTASVGWRPYGAPPPGGPPQEFIPDEDDVAGGQVLSDDDTAAADRAAAGEGLGQPTQSGGSGSSGGDRLRRGRSVDSIGTGLVAGNSLLSRLFGVDPIGEKLDAFCEEELSRANTNMKATSSALPSAVHSTSGFTQQQQQQQQQARQQQQQIGSRHGRLQPAGSVRYGGRVGGRRFWVADLLKLLITHVQLLGVLRNLQLNWPESVRTILIYFDQTQATTTWISIDCSLHRGDGFLPVAVQRVLVQLLFPLGALIVGVAYWGLFAVIRKARRRPLRGFKVYVYPRLVLSFVLILFYLYPTVTNVAVGLFSCTPIDNPAVESMAAGRSALKAVGTFWNQDTSLQCFTGAHAWLAYGLGIPVLIFFALGFPLGLAVLLWSQRKSLEHADVDLMYGFLYDSFRRKYYFWESIILLEKLTLVMAVTLMQRFAAAAQVLLAMAVIFVAAILQITFQPYGCRLLDTMQRGSLYTLQATLFLLMMAAITEISSDSTKTAAIVVIFLINICLVVLFIYVIFMEARRFTLAVLDRDGKGQVAWEDVKHFMHYNVLSVWSGGMRDQGVRVAVMGRAALPNGTLGPVQLPRGRPPKPRPGKAAAKPAQQGQGQEPAQRPATAGRVTVINPVWNPLTSTVGSGHGSVLAQQQPRGDDAA